MTDTAEKILNPTHVRQSVRDVIAQLETFHARGIPIPAELAAAVPIVCARLMRHETPRVAAMGAKLVVAALKHNLELSQHADKTARLDNGDDTERSTQVVVNIVRHEGPSGEMIEVPE